MPAGTLTAPFVETPAAPAPAAAGPRLAWRVVAAGSAFGLFLLSHPYSGIVHDAELYVARAVADTGSDALARDILFAHDGQSAFSLFPRLNAALVSLLGPDLAAIAVTLTGLFAWFGGLAAFASGFARGRLLWACIVCAAVVPGFYGQVFRYAEPFATPRLPAEALVLLGLAALLAGRAALSAATLVAAAPLHPIMAAPGVAIWLLVKARGDRRWLALPLAGLVLLVLAAACGLPVAERLFRLMNPAWAEALSVNAYLFPSRWAETGWTEAGVRAATVLLAIRFVAGRTAKATLAAILLVGFAGTALAAVAADRWLVVLVTQVQPWRALWLVALAGALVLPLVALGLWRSGRGGQVALACLASAWLTAPISPVGGVAAALALALAFADAKRPDLFSRAAAVVVWTATGALAALCLGQRILVLVPVLATRPPDADILTHLWLFWVVSIPIALAAILVAARRTCPIGIVPAGVGAAFLLGAAALAWNDRPPLGRVLDRHRPDPELLRLLPASPGEVLWLRNGAGLAWKLAGRANWASYLQGAAIVFSPELGRVWLERMDRLVAAGLADGSDRRPWSEVGGQVLRPDSAAFAAFCAAPDAPDAVVAPLDGSVALPDGVPTRTYVLPSPRDELRAGEGSLRWVRTTSYAVVDCATARQAGALRGTLPG